MKLKDTIEKDEKVSHEEVKKLLRTYEKFRVSRLDPVTFLYFNVSCIPLLTTGTIFTILLDSLFSFSQGGISTLNDQFMQELADLNKDLDQTRLRIEIDVAGEKLALAC